MTAPDLDAIKSQIAEIASLADAAEYSTGSLANQRLTGAWANLGANVPALVAEVERLRAGLAELVNEFGDISSTARAKGDESWRMAQTAVIACRALLKESLR